VEHGEGRNMNDEGIIGRSALSGKDSFKSLWVESECAEAIDGLCWEGDEMKLAEETSSTREGI